MNKFTTVLALAAAMALASPQVMAATNQNGGGRKTVASVTQAKKAKKPSRKAKKVSKSSKKSSGMKKLASRHKPTRKSRAHTEQAA